MKENKKGDDDNSDADEDKKTKTHPILLSFNKNKQTNEICSLDIEYVYDGIQIRQTCAYCLTKRVRTSLLLFPIKDQ